MVNMIKRDAQLAPYLHDVLEDAGITIGIDPTLQLDDYAAIKVDDYYADLHLTMSPKAVDFVVAVDCQCDAFALYILELKNVNGPEGLVLEDIKEKFGNTINSFLGDSFSYIFTNDRFKYKVIKLYLISDAYHEVGKFSNHAEYLKFRDRVNKRDTLKVDFSLSFKPYQFRGKILRIEYDIPPNPIIKRW